MHLLQRVVLVYAFWSILTGFWILLWSVPLRERVLTGAECVALLLPLAGPLSVKARRSRRLAWTLAVVLGLLVPGSACGCLGLPPLPRLVSSAIGACMASALVLSDAAAGAAWPLGACLFIIVKWAFYTSSPLWPGMARWNALGVCLLLCAVYSGEQPHDGHAEDPFSTACGLSVGFFLFITESLVYRPQGTHDVASIVHIMAMLLSSLCRMHSQVSRALIVLGMVPLYLLASSDLLYLGNVLLASGLMGRTRSFFEQGHALSPTTMSLALSVYASLVVAQSAHAYSAPTACLDRPWIMLFPLLFIVSADACKPSQRLDGLPALHAKKLAKTFSVLVGVGMASRMLGLHLRQSAPTNIVSVAKSELDSMLMEEFGGLPTIKVAIWSANFGLDKHSGSNVAKLAELVRKLDIDVVVFTESGMMGPMTGHRDFAQMFSASYPYKVHTECFEQASIISRIAISDSTRYDQLYRVGLRLGHRVTGSIVIALGENSLPTQAQSISNVVRSQHGPVIFIGHMDEADHARVFKNAVGNAGTSRALLHDIEPSAVDRQNKYIGHSQRLVIPLSFAMIDSGGISNAHLQAAAFALLPSYAHDFDQKWSLIRREARKTNGPYFKNWSFPEYLCAEGLSVECEYFYYITRKYF